MLGMEDMEDMEVMAMDIHYPMAITVQAFCIKFDAFKILYLIKFYQNFKTKLKVRLGAIFGHNCHQTKKIKTKFLEPQTK